MTLREIFDLSTIEGQLETVSVHGGRTFIVWESLTKNRIECSVPEELFAQWKELLGKRVAITGRVHYRNHVPKKIAADSIRVLRDASQLPQPKEMAPINLTDGLSSEEHVRIIRNG